MPQQEIYIGHQVVLRKTQLANNRVNISAGIVAKLDLAGSILADGLGKIGSDRTGLGRRHFTLRTKDTS